MAIVACVESHRMGGGRKVHLSQPYIARCLDVSRSTVKRRVEKLRLLGHLETREITDRSGNTTGLDFDFGVLFRKIPKLATPPGHPEPTPAHPDPGVSDPQRINRGTSSLAATPTGTATS